MKQGIAMALIVALGIVGGSVVSQVGSADAGPRFDQQQQRLAKQTARKVNLAVRKLNALTQQVESVNATLGSPDILKSPGTVKDDIYSLAVKQEKIWQMIVVMCPKLEDGALCHRLAG